MTVVVEIKDVVFKRGDREIFSGLNLTIEQGKVTAIMGPSGTGKTTLLKLIGGQLVPDEGCIKVFGQDVSQLSRKALYAMRKRLGLLFQTGGLFTNMSVFDNVAFPLREHSELNERKIHDVVLMKLEAVGLRGARDLMPAELSGGMNRRVALARTIAMDPEIIMYDEPFAGQDPISMGVLVKLIRHLNDASAKLTSVIVSHDVAETCSIADYVYVIAGGKVITEGSPDVLDRDASPEAQQFLKGLPDGPVSFHYPAPPLEDDLWEAP